MQLFQDVNKIKEKLISRRAKVTYVRQPLMKSKNKASFDFKAAGSSFELGLRFFPLLLVMFLGFPLESVHKRQRGLLSHDLQRYPFDFSSRL